MKTLYHIRTLASSHSKASLSLILKCCTVGAHLFELSLALNLSSRYLCKAQQSGIYMPGVEKNRAFLDFRVSFLDELWLTLICSGDLSITCTTIHKPPRAGQRGYFLTWKIQEFFEYYLINYIFILLILRLLKYYILILSKALIL